MKKGVVSQQEITACIDSMDAKGIMSYGQKIVAKAWLDEGFKVYLFYMKYVVTLTLLQV